MDRSDYRIKLDEIHELIAQGQSEEAFEELSGMNWRKVPNVNIILEAASIYEDADRLEDARDLLEIAHERASVGRRIIYRLALVEIRLRNFDAANEYYDEFVEIAPHDSDKYVIRYELAKARGSDPQTLIGILEELKAHDFIDRWAYELAYLYHTTGQADKCIDLCDEIILYFGDGPYVEHALELKMLYRKLSREQENKYRAFCQKRDGVTEITPEDKIDSSQILHRPVEIPEVELPEEKFDTVSLSAEIKKNIDEIMAATETDEVTENMEAIKELVGDFPYLQADEGETAPEKADLEAGRKIDDTLKFNFQNYLIEEHDGQMSLLIPDTPQEEPVMAGQMTIEDVMASWEKTRRAAKAALDDAQAQQLEHVKSRAIAEANTIIDRIEGASDKLNAGVTTNELLKEEILAKESAPEEEPAPAAEASAPVAEKPAQAEEPAPVAEKPAQAAEKPAPAAEEPKAFEIPVIVRLKQEKKTGIDAWEPPVFAAPASASLKGKPEPAADKAAAASEADRRKAAMDELMRKMTELTKEDAPPVDIDEATKIVEQMTELLQKEIERVGNGEESSETDLAQKRLDEAQNSMREFTQELIRQRHAAAQNKAEKVKTSDARPEDAGETTPQSKRQEPESTAEESALQTEPESEIEAAEEETPVHFDDSQLLAGAVTGMLNEADTDGDGLPDAEITDKERERQEKELDFSNTVDLSKELTDIDSDTNTDITKLSNRIVDEAEAEEEKQLQENPDAIEEALTEAIDDDESLPTQLTEKEKEIFSYFTPIAGMEQALCQILIGARDRLSRSGNSATGNILIQGGKGSGKTTLATSLIKVLQEEIGRPKGPVGKIDGEKLNDKNIQQLMKKIEGGCLIVEKAGELSRQSEVTLSLLMRSDQSGTLMILEDTRIGLQRAMNLDSSFASMFTEKISIPILTIDELVNFGKAYAKDLGYSIEEMGVLALYDRINKITRLDHPTYLTEVKEIVDEAIDESEHRGFFARFSGKKYDEEGNILLIEKDFQE